MIIVDIHDMFFGHGMPKRSDNRVMVKEDEDGVRWVVAIDYLYEGREYECEVAFDAFRRVAWVDVWLDGYRVIITADMREAIVMQAAKEYF